MNMKQSMILQFCKAMSVSSPVMDGQAGDDDGNEPGSLVDLGWAVLKSPDSGPGSEDEPNIDFELPKEEEETEEGNSGSEAMSMSPMFDDVLLTSGDSSDDECLVSQGHDSSDGATNGKHLERVIDQILEHLDGHGTNGSIQLINNLYAMVADQHDCVPDKFIQYTLKLRCGSACTGSGPTGPTFGFKKN